MTTRIAPPRTSAGRLPSVFCKEARDIVPFYLFLDRLQFLRSVPCHDPAMPQLDPKRPFVIGCSREIFSDEEIEILEQYGRQLERLTNGERLPKTEAQQRFVEVAQGRCDPESVYERTWAKYLWRVVWESHPENRSAMGKRRSVPNDREDWKRMRGAVWAEVRRRAQGWDD